MASRLTVDEHGRLTVVQTTPEIGITVGDRFLVLSDAFGDSIYFLAKAKGRRPTAREQMEARGYSGGLARRGREAAQDGTDEALAEAAAIELARREQERQPADLIGGRVGLSGEPVKLAS